MGYRHEKDKFGIAGLTPIPAADLRSPRVLECPVHMEALLAARHELEQGDPERWGALVALELRIVRVHVDPNIRMGGYRWGTERKESLLKREAAARGQKAPV
jgi:flavin reductase (DIM6/NTAB) family NADH-FMN oxidoreductase RutF